MSIKLQELPFESGSLEPYISKRTVEMHHGGHQKGYVDKVNKAVAGTEYDDMSLPEIIGATAGSGDDKALFQSAAQAWNHAFYWSSMSSSGRRVPEGELAKQIAKDFGSLDEFHADFLKTAKGVFGSGWAWVVWGDGRLSIKGTSNADIPLGQNELALYCCDVWEHAYYLDYQKDRGQYIQDCLEHLHDWRVTEERFELRHSAPNSLEMPLALSLDYD